MTRPTIAAVTTAAVLAIAFVPGADATQKKKRFGLDFSCTQASVDSTTDTFTIDLTVTNAKTKKPLSGATLTATLTGPAVTSGHARDKSDATGAAELVTSFGGPGTYTMSIRAKRKKYKTVRFSIDIAVSGPMDGPCAVQP